KPDARAAATNRIQLPAPGPVSEAEKSQLNRMVATWYDSLLGRSNFNGSVLVAKSGNIIYTRYNGTAHLPGKDSINSETPFHIASVSKTLTAMATLKLWEAGKFQLDDPFQKYFPAFNYPEITIRSLLTHRSGLPNYVYFMEELGWDKKQYIHNADVLQYLITRKAESKNIGRPNTYFSYCNTNYALLALLIEKMSGQSFPDYMKSQLFEPIGMTHSFIFQQSDSGHVPLSYDWRGQLIPLNFLDLVYGDKNMYSTAEDILKWDRALKPDVFLKAATLEEAYKPYSNEKAGIRNYGLGWRLNVYPDGYKVVYHNGWWHGNNASFVRLIPEDITIIVLGNRFNKSIYKTKYLVGAFNQNLTPVKEEEGDTAKAGGSH
ncbi:MAG TPA: serine hydrolase domain-containing protein, partial [Ferruginibacter sp.]|nr:serine hydrolase domain-containing protein [Ferruginibacter sp.]